MIDDIDRQVAIDIAAGEPNHDRKVREAFAEKIIDEFGPPDPEHDAYTEGGWCARIRELAKEE